MTNLNKSLSEMRQTYPSITDAMERATRRNNEKIFVIGYHPDSDVGGGNFVYDANRSKSDHNGGTVIDPDKTFPSDWTNSTQVNDWFTADGVGNGVYLRPNVEYVTAEMFGALGGNPINDQTCFEAALANNSVVNLLESKSYTLPTLNISSSNRILNIPNSTEIIFDASILGSVIGLNVTGAFCYIKGGSLRSSESASLTWIVSISGFGSKIDGVTVNDPTKSNYVGDGTNIPYNRGCIRVDQPNCVVNNCNIYNAEGAGIWNYRENTRITENRIHDNITGIVLDYGGSLGFGDNTVVSSNVIYDNNAGSTLHMSGADGILTYKTTKGHTITINTISNNGEHGTYIQSTKNTVVGNVVFDNPGSGLKFGGGFESTISANNCYNNAGDISPNDDADIYIQSPFGNTVVQGNTCINSSGVYGIRCVWLESKAIVGEESNMTFSGNSVYGVYSVDAIRVSGEKGFVVNGNSSNGNILISQSTTNHPVMTNTSVSNNTCVRLTIDKASAPIIKNNDCDEFYINSSASAAIVNGNNIRLQTSAIGSLKDISQFSFNNIVYTETVTTNPLFTQGGSVSDNSGKRFAGNVFNSSGGRIIYFTSDSISGNDITFIDNELNGVVNQCVYMWGENHQFIGNRETGDGGTLCFIRGTNNIITNNLGVIAVEIPASNTVDNNLTRV